jgi:hypothetical protein|tara:strand:- start:308 stop:604 length:297 start_codon:yes stop_codon:yes gene_type:complete
MLKTETKTEKRYKASPNPYLCKSGFYITELNMGMMPEDGYKLISTSDLAGPFKTLQRARQVFKDKVINDPYLNDYEFDIRGPKDITGSIWYAGKERLE